MDGRGGGLGEGAEVGGEGIGKKEKKITKEEIE